MPALLLVFRCHFVEKNGVTIIAYSDRLGGRGQGKFIVAAGITKNSSAVPAMMLEQGEKIETIKNESIPSVSRSMSHAAAEAARPYRFSLQGQP